MMGVIARKELVQALLTYRFAVGLILCTVAVAAGMLAALEDYGSRQQAYHQELQTYQAEVLNAQGCWSRPAATGRLPVW